MKQKPYEWIRDDSFETKYAYNRFINWISGEFVLNQQENIDGLKVFFPNGWFFINVLNPKNNSIGFRIEVKSKCLKSGTQIFNQIVSILKHAKIFHSEFINN
ncbi:MAG: hypothetical protein GZ086_02850 [Gelidibacter sp.]|nr:hypothetical protein [Gelidibacter sp.]